MSGRCSGAILLSLSGVACGASGTSATSPDATDAGRIEGEASSPAADAGPFPSDAGASADAVSPGDADEDSPAPPPLPTLGFIAGSAYSLYVRVGGGSAHPVQLDTGSLGLYVPAAVLGSGVSVGTTACSITYVSSGTTLSGHEATATIELLGSKTTGDVTPPPASAPTTFCAVDDPTWTGGMMGVGFGRSMMPDPTRNVLLQTEAPAPAHAGYVLSTHPSAHVQLGVAGTTGFQTVPLVPDPGGSGDWVATSLRGCLSLPATPGFTPLCGPLLVDTGVAECLLWGPPDPTLGGAVPSGQTTVPSGTAMVIEAEAGASTLDYAFTVGSGADSPASVTLRTATAFSINTGRALLVDNDYLFDAKAGVVGFRKAP